MDDLRRRRVLASMEKDAGVGEWFGKIVGAPVKSIAADLGGLLVGKVDKLKNPTRKWWEAERTGVKAISEAKLKKLKEIDAKTGKSEYDRVGHRFKEDTRADELGNLKKYHTMETYGPGGLAGWARKHPFLSAGGAAVGYAALKTRKSDVNVTVNNGQQSAGEEQAMPAGPINWG